MSPPALKRVRAQRADRAPQQQQSPPNDDGRALLVLSDTTDDSLLLEFSKPQPGEECCIAMEPIESYRLEWLPADAVQGQPELTKATLPCGHGFHALSLLYFMAKCEMTCPCCRQGHSRQRMARESIPPHVRAAMVPRLDRLLREEREEQVASDALAVSNMLQEQRPGARWGGVELDRPVLIVLAYPTLHTPVPPLVQELPMLSTATQDPATRETAFELTTSSGSIRELNRNIQMLPLNLRAFSLVVAVRTHLQGVLSLARSERFLIADMPAGRTSPVPLYSGGGEVALSVDVDAAGLVSGVALRLPQSVLPTLLIRDSEGPAIIEADNNSISSGDADADADDSEDGAFNMTRPMLGRRRLFLIAAEQF